MMACHPGADAANHDTKATVFHKWGSYGGVECLLRMYYFSFTPRVLFQFHPSPEHFSTALWLLGSLAHCGWAAVFCWKSVHTAGVLSFDGGLMNIIISHCERGLIYWAVTLGSFVVMRIIMCLDLEWPLLVDHSWDGYMDLNFLH